MNILTFTKYKLRMSSGARSPIWIFGSDIRIYPDIWMITIHSSEIYTINIIIQYKLIFIYIFHLQSDIWQNAILIPTDCFIIIYTELQNCWVGPILCRILWCCTLYEQENGINSKKDLQGSKWETLGEIFFVRSRWNWLFWFFYVIQLKSLFKWINGLILICTEISKYHYEIIMNKYTYCYNTCCYWTDRYIIIISCIKINRIWEKIMCSFVALKPYVWRDNLKK